MNRRSEQEVKLSFLESIAASQQAVARMMNSVSDVIPHSGISAKSLEETLCLLASYQEQITRMIKVTGISLNRQVKGSPALPWMSRMKGVYAPVSDRHARKEEPYETET